MKVGGDEKKAGKDEGRNDREESGVPEAFRSKANGEGGSQAKSQRKHESCGGKDAEGGDGEESDVKKDGVHEVRDYKKTDRLKYKKTDPLGRTRMRW